MTLVTFGVRRALAALLSIDLSMVSVYRRQVASKKSGDKSPHSKQEGWHDRSV
jgi:hypothetical protein